MDGRRLSGILGLGLLVLTISACGVQTTEEPSLDEPDVEADSPVEDVRAESDPLPDPLIKLVNEMAGEGCTFGAYRMGWVMDWADAGNIVDTVFGPDSFFNSTFWGMVEPESADLFRDIAYRAYREVDFETRAGMWREAERIIVEDALIVIPLNYYDRTALVNTDLTYIFPPFGGQRIADWSSKIGETTLVLPMGGDPITLDTSQCGDTGCSLVLSQLTDSPYKFTEDGTIEPLAATGFEVNEDHTLYTVHLREDAVWSDGVPVLAQHYVDGVLRLMDPAMGNAYAYVMMGIEGAPAYTSAEVSTLESVKAIDDFTLQFQLSEPLSYFDSLLAFSVFHPIRKDIMDAYPETYMRPGVMVSNGAYILTDYVLGSHITLEKNPTYWDAANVSFDRIEMPIIGERATCVAAFEAGDIDVASCGFPPEDMPRWVDRPEFVRLPRPGTHYLALNLLSEHIRDIDFRKALAYSLDKRIWIDTVLEMPWMVEPRGVIPPEIYGYQGNAIGFDHDVDRAQEYLEKYMSKAGIDDPEEITIELWSAGAEDYLETIQVMWQEALGIKVRIIAMEWGTYLDTLATCMEIATSQE